MAWASLANNQFVSRNDLQDAVTTGVFFLRPAQTIPAGNNFVIRSEVETWIYASVTAGAANQWPQKSWIVPIATTTTSTSTTSTTTTLPPTTTTTSTTSTSTTTTTTVAPTTTSTTSTTTTLAPTTTTTTTTTLAPTTTTTTSSSTTTTTTTIHIPSFIVNVHNSTSDLNITGVHGTGGYNPPFSYPILPGQNVTDSNWPMSQFGGAGGMFVEKQALPAALYHLDLYRNGALEHQENSVGTIGTGGYHFSFGFSPAGADGDVIDIYVLPGNV